MGISKEFTVMENDYREFISDPDPVYVWNRNFVFIIPADVLTHTGARPSARKHNADYKINRNYILCSMMIFYQIYLYCVW